MYRQYEDPRKLEKMLQDAERRLSDAQASGTDDLDRLIDLHQEVEELRDRVNFAWQDEEYDELERCEWE
jgi:uncharacterized sporulation protein YeaH/YhbH (DUF444 family)